MRCSDSVHFTTGCLWEWVRLLWCLMMLNSICNKADLAWMVLQGEKVKKKSFTPKKMVCYEHMAHLSRKVQVLPVSLGALGAWMSVSLSVFPLTKLVGKNLFPIFFLLGGQRERPERQRPPIETLLYKRRPHMVWLGHLFSLLTVGVCCEPAQPEATCQLPLLLQGSPARKLPRSLKCPQA